MVFKKLLAGLGFGGVDVDTVLFTPQVQPGASLSGEVRLTARGDVEITTVLLQLMVGGGSGGHQIEIARIPVAHGLRLGSGASHSVPFSVPVPAALPATVVYGKHLPGAQVGVRTEVVVASGSDRTDFDPFAVVAPSSLQHMLDALGTIGCRFLRNEVRPGAMAGLPVPVAQAITFYAPIPEGQQPGPHIPQLVVLVAGDDAGMTVVMELAGRPGQGQVHRLSTDDIRTLGDDGAAWITKIDGWVRGILETLGQSPQAAQGSFFQPVQQPHPGHHRQRHGRYAYGGYGHSGYSYGGYRGGGMGGAVAAGLGGAALGFFGGMIIGDMISDALAPDVADAAGDYGDGGDFGGGDLGGDVADPGAEQFADYGGGDYGGDYGGGDFGGGDFGGGDFGGGFGGGEF